MRQTFCSVGQNGLKMGNNVDNVVQTFRGILAICDSNHPEVENNCQSEKYYIMRDLVTSFEFGQTARNSEDCKIEFTCDLPANNLEFSSVSKRVNYKLHIRIYINIIIICLFASTHST
jgi:hypothetical protein